MLAGVAFGQHFGQLIAYALRRDLANATRLLLDLPEGHGLDRVSEARRKADGAQHTQSILGESPSGFADGPDGLCFHVFLTADKIEHPVLQGVEQQAIDREVAPFDILPRLLAEANLVRVAAVV